MAEQRPEIANPLRTGTFETNYNDVDQGFPVTLFRGSGPGLTAWARS
jgi:2-hydroxymuconate-semialdehyde hydrolase